MTHVSFDREGADVEFEGTSFRLERELLEEAIGKSYFDITDHEVLKIVDPNPPIEGQARQIAELLD